MKQKFPRYTFVHIAPVKKKNRDFMDSVLGRDCDAIVEGTYAQLYPYFGGGRSARKDYSLYIMKNGEVVNNVSWFPEEILTALEHQDKEKAKALIKNFNRKMEK